MTRLKHLLVIPDGNRRHAKREYLCSLLRESREAFERAIASIAPEHRPELSRRIETYLLTEQDRGLENPVDLLDYVREELPQGVLLRSYRKSGRLIDELLRSCLSDRSLDVFSVYGMQARNLSRTDAEVQAFLEVESDYARRWAADPELNSRCRFRAVGDRSAFEKLETPRLKEAAAEYSDALAALEQAGQGDELCVNILAPYDFMWEIELAVVDGRFDRSQLAVTEDVSLVIRSGAIGRSLTSGALPLQVAFSAFHSIPTYFPDCTIPDFKQAIDDYGRAHRKSGL